MSDSPEPKVGERWRVTSVIEGEVQRIQGGEVCIDNLWFTASAPRYTWEKFPDPEPPWMSIVTDSRGWAWQNVEGTWHCDSLRNTWAKLNAIRGPITILRFGGLDV